MESTLNEVLADPRIRVTRRRERALFGDRQDARAHGKDKRVEIARF